MNLKVAAIALILIGFLDSGAVERNTIKYSEVVNQLIEAATLDDAKTILKNHDFLDQGILHEYLLERQRLWVAEHGLYDVFTFGRGSSPAAQYFFGAISIVSFSLFSIVVYAICQSGPKYKDGCDTAMRLAVTGIVTGLFSLAACYEDPIAKQQIKEFQRIKQLLTCVG